MRTERELLDCLEKNYKTRIRRLNYAVQDGARRTDMPLRSNGERCAICTLKERGGGLFTYALRDGQELLVGHTCAEYLDYLLSHPEYIRPFRK